MADREENVYQAKLAEQAERYDGELIIKNKYRIQESAVDGIQIYFAIVAGNYPPAQTLNFLQRWCRQ